MARATQKGPTNDRWPEEPSKAAVEAAWLWYTPVWMALAGTVITMRWADEVMGDASLLAFAVALGAGVALSPVIYAWRRGVALKGRVLAAMVLANMVLSFGLNYFQTPFFFDVLHMRYGFKVQWRIERNPVFLYVLTMPYFATYTAAACWATRYVQRRLTTGSTRWLRVPVLCLVPFFFAFMETLSHVNPMTDRIFCYDDQFFALTFGTACYGVAFALALPVWMSIGGVPETPRRRANPMAAVVAMFAVVLLDTGFLWVARHYIAPHFTTVVQDSPPFGGCLVKA